MKFHENTSGESRGDKQTDRYDEANSRFVQLFFEGQCKKKYFFGLCA
jgi:hypothetical protein